MQGWKSKLCGVRLLKVRAGKVFAFINLVIVFPLQLYHVSLSDKSGN